MTIWRKSVTSLIKALINLVEHKKTLVEKNIKSHTLANALGDSFENFIIDAFADTFEMDRESKLRIHEKLFSWMGNQNNPPDLIIKNSDAIEVKKTHGLSYLALNSSFPKAHICHNSFGVTQDCRNCEGNDVAWEKDIIYVCGIVSRKKVT